MNNIAEERQIGDTAFADGTDEACGFKSAQTIQEVCSVKAIPFSPNICRKLSFHASSTDTNKKC